MWLFRFNLQIWKRKEEKQDLFTNLIINNKWKKIKTKQIK